MRGGEADSISCSDLDEVEYEDPEMNVNTTAPLDDANTYRAQPGRNRTYDEIMADFGIKNRGSDGPESMYEKVVREKAEDKRRREEDRVLLHEAVAKTYYDPDKESRKKPHKHWLPIPGTAVPYEQPTGMWEPGDDPEKFMNGGPECDGFSEAAMSGFAPFNYKAWRPNGGMHERYPAAFPELRDEDGNPWDDGKGTVDGGLLPGERDFAEPDPDWEPNLESTSSEELIESEASEVIPQLEHGKNMIKEYSSGEDSVFAGLEEKLAKRDALYAKKAARIMEKYKEDPSKFKDDPDFIKSALGTQDRKRMGEEVEDKNPAKEEFDIDDAIEDSDEGFSDGSA